MSVKHTLPPSSLRPLIKAMQHPLKPRTIADSAGVCGAALALALSTPAMAQQMVEIPAQPLASALKSLGQQTGLQIIYNAELVAGRQSPPVQGTFETPVVLGHLLEGTGIRFNVVGNTVTLTKAGGDVMMMSPVRVEGEAEGRFGDAPVEPGGFKAEYQTTATKMALSLRETPQAISVVTQESIAARQADDLHSALELKAGIAGSWYGAPGPFAGSAPNGGSNAFSIRGQRLDHQNDIRSDGFAVSAETNYDAAIYERIELVKGPSGFYGQGSLGGFINMVRKKPQAEFASSISAQVGSYDTYRGELDVTGALNKNNTVTGRMIAVYGDEGSFIDGVETERYTLAPSLEVQIGDRTRALLQLLYQNEDFIPTVGVPLRVEGNKYVPYDLDRSFISTPVIS